MTQTVFDRSAPGRYPRAIDPWHHGRLHQFDALARHLYAEGISVRSLICCRGMEARPRRLHSPARLRVGAVSKQGGAACAAAV